MSQFISKLQYRNYEPGEFDGEKVRGLVDTLQLIKNFPWNEQRGGDNEPTGPSVTIQDESKNFLKVTFYNEENYCVYYLDSGNHFYEYDADTLNDVDKLVTDFFESKLDLGLFHEHMFNAQNGRHFITGNFRYRATLGRVIAQCFLLILLLMVIIVAPVIAFNSGSSSNKPVPAYMTIMLVFFFALITLPVIIILAIIYRKYLRCRNQVLEITRGKETFLFGTGADLRTYHKNDVQKIVCYQRSGNHSPMLFSIYDIYFKNSDMIHLTSMLIPDYKMGAKFPPELFVYSGGNFLKRL